MPLCHFPFSSRLPAPSSFSPLFYRKLMSVCPSSLLVTSFLILSLLVLPFILLSQLISVVKSLLSSSLLRHQHSEPYSSTGMTKVSYNFNFVFCKKYNRHKITTYP